MAKKTSRFAFTEASLRDLPPPAAGRAWHYDTKSPGLCVCRTAAGGCSFHFYKWLNGKPSRSLIGKFPDVSVKAARDAAAESMAKVAKGEESRRTAATATARPHSQNLFDHWMIYARAHKKPSSVSGDEWLWKHYLDDWGSRRLGAIQKTDVQSHHALVGREHGIYSANRMLALLRAMLNKGDELGYTGKNPAAGVKLFKEVSRDRFLQPSELKAFFVALDEEPPLFRDFFLVSLLTGARRGNVQSMTWDDLDLANGIWRIPETKGGIPVIVPLVAPVVVILELRRTTANGGPWVFPGSRHGQHLGKTQDGVGPSLQKGGAEQPSPP